MTVTADEKRAERQARREDRRRNAWRGHAHPYPTSCWPSCPAYDDGDHH